MSNASKKLTYFAHPISLYNSPLEGMLIEALTTLGFSIVNPGEAQYQRAYESRRVAKPKENPMTYWIELANTCDNCIFTPFPREQNDDAKVVSISQKPLVGAGVIKEVNSFIARRRPVYWVSPDVKRLEEVETFLFTGWSKFKLLTIAQTKALLLQAHCEKQDKLIKKISELLDGLVIDPVKGVILTPEKERQVAEFKKMEQETHLYKS